MYYDEGYEGMMYANESFEISNREAQFMITTESLSNFLVDEDDMYADPATESFNSMKRKISAAGTSVWQKIQQMIDAVRKFLSNMVTWVVGPSFTLWLPEGGAKISNWANQHAKRVAEAVHYFSSNIDNFVKDKDVSSVANEKLDSVKEAIKTSGDKLIEELKAMKNSAGEAKDGSKGWERRSGKIKDIVKEHSALIEQSLSAVEKIRDRVGLADMENRDVRVSAACTKAINILHGLANKVKIMMNIISIKDKATKDEIKENRNSSKSARETGTALATVGASHWEE